MAGVFFVCVKENAFRTPLGLLFGWDWAGGKNDWILLFFWIVGVVGVVKGENAAGVMGKGGSVGGWCPSGLPVLVRVRSQTLVSNRDCHLEHANERFVPETPIFFRKERNV